MNHLRQILRDRDHQERFRKFPDPILPPLSIIKYYWTMTISTKKIGNTPKPNNRHAAYLPILHHQNDNQNTPPILKSFKEPCHLVINPTASLARMSQLPKSPSPHSFRKKTPRWPLRHSPPWQTSQAFLPPPVQRRCQKIPIIPSDRHKIPW